ncbi:diacylglycerol kinase family lipid kinase [Eubacteriales bacterium OttesenSCG-928-K08]|nr:diacylglycerol kinase family lipid kinase [Eubacteriales bacterium OttesenSCG-928-K08]
MPSLHFIYNPVAGNGLSQKAFEKMQALLDERQIPYSFAESQYAGHTCELTRQAMADGHSCIVAVGGDGTVREVAMQLVNTNIPFSFLPCGTGNDLARALHMPDDPEKVLDMLLNNAPRPMDAGTTNGELFINVSGFGFDVDVLIYTELYKKRFRGSLAYVLGLLHALKDLKLRKIHVETAEGLVFDSNALVVTAGNGTHFGGGMNVTPEATPFDGLFDVCVISDVKLSTVFRVLLKFMKGKHLGLPIVKYFRSSEFTVSSDPPSPLELDGEIMLETPVTFKILPGALQVIASEQ